RYIKTETENGVKLSTSKGKKVAVKENVFDILYKLHHRKGHAGCNVMYNSSTLQKYEGITKALILLFLKCCRSCELKKASVRKSLVVKPILSADFNVRCHLDLIDLQSKPDGEYRFIFVYQDHLTKYVILRALKEKTAVAVEDVLRQVFCDFGPPAYQRQF
uniref:Integrase n=1 Tax=Panagrolaimus sp. PS1159 TaxID=55785 RepID=A0AC35G0B0_9BILA